MRRMSVWTLVALTFVSTMTSAQSRNPEPMALGPLARAALDKSSNGRTPVELSVQGPTVPATRTQSWPKRHPVVTGLLIGASVGALYGAVSKNDDSDDGARVGAAATIGGLGLGFGAAIGFMIGLTY